MLKRRSMFLGLAFASPAIVSFLMFWLVPLVTTLYYSTTQWRVGSKPKPVGATNYANLASDPLFAQALMASMKIALYAVVPSLLIAMTLALCLNDPRIRAGRLWRMIMMIPVVTDWVATGLVFQLIFLPNQGVLAGFFAGLGLEQFVRVPWTSDATLAPIAIAIFVVWKQTGLYTLFLFAAIRSVPNDVIEASAIDGAGAWRTFWLIRWPLMVPVTVFVVVLAFITTLGLFEPVFMLTGGGPANATRTLPLFLYENFFTNSKSGYASAAGVVFLLMSLAFAFFAGKLMKDQAV